MRPLRDVELLLVQGTRTWPLGTADADERYDTRWQVVLPADAAPGPAVLRAGNAEVPLTIR